MLVHRKVEMFIKLPSVAAHPSEDVLEEYVFLRLSEKDTATVEEHLLACPDCCQIIKNIDEFVLAMKQNRDAGVISTPGRSVRWKILGYGAAAAATVLALTAVTILPATRRVGDATPVQLVAFRGGESGAMIPARAGAALTLAVDLADLTPSGSYRLQIVDAKGTQVWNGESHAAGGTLKMQMSHGLKPGIYWIRLYSGDNLVREFGVHAQ